MFIGVGDTHAKTNQTHKAPYPVLLAHLVRTAATEGVRAAGAQHVAFTQVAAAVARHAVPLRVGGRDGQG